MNIRFQRIGALLILIALSLTLLASCGKQESELFSEPAQLNDAAYKIGVGEGTAAMSMAEEAMPKAKIEYFGGLSDGFAAVQSGKIDGFCYNTANLEYVVANNPDLAVLPGSLGEVDIVVGTRKGNEALIDQVNAFIASIQADGTYNEMYSRWILEAHEEMPALAPGTGEPLIVGLDAVIQPFNYYKGDLLVGFDVEFAYRLGVYLNREVRFEVMNYGGLIPAASSGAIDLVIANMNATDERREALLLSDPYMQTPVGILVRKDRMAEAGIRRFSDLEGKRIGQLTGSVFFDSVDTYVKNYEKLYFDDLVSQGEALKNNKCDAIALDEPVARLLVAQNPELEILSQPLADDEYGFAFRKGNPLCDQVSEVISAMREDGTLDEIAARWLSGDEQAMRLPEITPDAGHDLSGGVLRYGLELSTKPMCYMGPDGTPIGLDVEIVTRVAYALNRRVEFVPMNFASLISAVSSDKVDLVGGCMSITEERKQSVDFCEPYYFGGRVLVVRSVEGATPSAAGIKTGRVGVMTGSTGEILMREQYPDNTMVSSYDGFADAVAALQGGKLDYVIGSYTTMLNFARHNPDLAVCDGELKSEGVAIAVRKGNTELLTKLDQVLTRFSQDGTLQDITDRWIKADGTDYERSDIPVREDGPVLRVAVSADREPMCFISNDTYVGLDCELIERIAYELGMRVEYQNMKFAGLIAALQGGKADLVISNLTRTDERAESVDFTQEYFHNPQAALAKKPGAAVSQPWYTSLAESFRKNFIVEARYKMILRGLGITIVISLLSALFGTLLGFLICLMRRSRHKWLAIPAKVYIRIIQAMPHVVLLMVLYYLVFSDVPIPAVMVAVIGFSLSFAAYVSEMMRTGIDAVDKGQLEAASAMGFSRVQVFSKITFPQAARHVLPVYKGEFVSMMKMTSVVGYIAIQDLTKASDIIRSLTYQAFFPLITTAIIYFLISYALTSLLSLVEFRVDPKHRKRIVKGVNNVQ